MFYLCTQKDTTAMDLQHPTFQDIALINAAVQANEEEERTRPYQVKSSPSDELPSGSGSSSFAAVVVCTVVICVLLAFILA